MEEGKKRVGKIGRVERMGGKGKERKGGEGKGTGIAL